MKKKSRSVCVIWGISDMSWRWLVPVVCVMLAAWFWTATGALPAIMFLLVGLILLVITGGAPANSKRDRSGGV
jgi:hypothetical protein